LQDDQVEEQILKNLGNACYALGNYAKVIEYYQQRLVLAREMGDRRTEAQILRNLGNVCYSLAD
jgi:tetratricopeptide (TPR) repeat protein